MLSDISELGDACVLVIEHIVRGTQAICGHFPAPESFNDDDARVGTLFTYLVGTAVLSRLDEIEQLDERATLLSRAALSAVRSHNQVPPGDLVPMALVEYRAMIEAAEHNPSLRQFLQTVERAVVLYVRSGDDSLFQMLAELYMTLFRARDK